MPTATLNRPLRILFLGMLLAAPAVRADSYTDFQDASARLEAMVAKATPQSGLPRLGEPGVAALFAQAADGRNARHLADGLDPMGQEQGAGA